jgi:ATP-dependent Clp protease ATP-binding subunit ClpA
VDETIRILEGLRDKYEAHHRVRYTPGAIEAAANSPTATSPTVISPIKPSI